MMMSTDVEACLSEVVQNVFSKFEQADVQWRSTVAHLEDQVRLLQRQVLEQEARQGEMRLQHAQREVPLVRVLSPREQHELRDGSRGSNAGKGLSGSPPLAKRFGSTSSHEEHLDPNSAIDDFTMRGVQPNWRPFQSTTTLSASACGEHPAHQDLDGSVSLSQEMTPGPRRTSNVEIIDPAPAPLNKTTVVDVFSVGGGTRRRPPPGNDTEQSPTHAGRDDVATMRDEDLEMFHLQLETVVARVVAAGSEVKESLEVKILALERALSASVEEAERLKKDLERERTAAAVARAEVQQHEEASNELVKLLNEQIVEQRSTMQEMELDLLAMRDEGLERDLREEESIQLVNEWYGQVNAYLEQISVLQDQIQLLERENELIRDANAASSQELSTVQAMHDQVQELQSRLDAYEEKDKAALSGLVERSTLSGVAQAQHHEIALLRQKLSLATMRAQDAETQVEELAERIMVLEASFCATTVRLHHQDGLQSAATAERGLRTSYVASGMDQKLLEANKEVAAIALVLRNHIEQSQMCPNHLPVASAELELRLNLRSLRDLVAIAGPMLLAHDESKSSCSGAHEKEKVRSALTKPLVYLHAAA